MTAYSHDFDKGEHSITTVSYIICNKNSLETHCRTTTTYMLYRTFDKSNAFNLKLQFYICSLFVYICCVLYILKYIS